MLVLMSGSPSMSPRRPPRRTPRRRASRLGEARARARLAVSLGVLALLALASLGGCDVARARRLLRAGRAKAALAAVRPNSPAAYRVRARALRTLGRLAEARTEARIAVVLDPDHAAGQRLLGFLEARLGAAGAAMRCFERSLSLSPNQPRLRRIVAKLLVRRALTRAALHGEKRAAAEDLRRARALDPGLDRATLSARLAAEAAAGRRRAHRSAARCEPSPTTIPPAAARRCALRAPGRLLRRIQARSSALGCDAARLAWRLERARCLSEALTVWRALRRSAPTEPRWALALARALLAARRPLRAQQLMLEHVVGSDDKAAAQLAVTRLWLAASARAGAADERYELVRRARRSAVHAMAVARQTAQRLEALRLMRRAGAQPRRLLEAAYVVVDGAGADPAVCARARAIAGAKLRCRARP